MDTEPRAEAYFNRGNVYISQGDYNRAIANYDRAIEIDPDSSLAYGNRAIAYVRQRNYRGAIAYNNRAALFALQGDKQGTCQDLEQAAQLLLERGNTAQSDLILDNIDRLRC